MKTTLTMGAGVGTGAALSTATLAVIPLGEAAIGQAVGVSLQLAGSIAIFALIIWAFRKSFELSLGTK